MCPILFLTSLPDRLLASLALTFFLLLGALVLPILLLERNTSKHQ
jgi:hypothetical protein